MSAGYLPEVGTTMCVMAKVLYHVGPLDVDGKPFAYVVEFSDGRLRTLSKTDTSEWCTLVIAE